MQLTTEKGNELIARFMGYSEGEDNYHNGMTDDKGSNTYPCWVTPDGNKITHFYYHSSWDWLMPVVEKIEEVLFKMLKDSMVNGRSRLYALLDRTGNFMWSSTKPYWSHWTLEEMGGDGRIGEMLFDIKAYGKTKIECVYNTVVQFIQWHNAQNKPI